MDDEVRSDPHEAPVVEPVQVGSQTQSVGDDVRPRIDVRNDVRGFQCICKSCPAHSTFSICCDDGGAELSLARPRLVAYIVRDYLLIRHRYSELLNPLCANWREQALGQRSWINRHFDRGSICRLFLGYSQTTLVPLHPNFGLVVRQSLACCRKPLLLFLHSSLKRKIPGFLVHPPVLTYPGSQPHYSVGSVRSSRQAEVKNGRDGLSIVKDGRGSRKGYACVRPPLGQRRAGGEIWDVTLWQRLNVGGSTSVHNAEQ